jgi:hypothetical protein
MNTSRSIKKENLMPGQPPYKPTEADRNTVRSMIACGFSQEVTASCCGTSGIDPKTMRQHFRPEIDTAAAKATATVANVLYQRATMGEAWAVCFWLKCRGGWREVQTVEHSGLAGAPIDLSIGESAREHLLRKLQGISERMKNNESDGKIQ